jgi:hypothetical protein
MTEKLVKTGNDYILYSKDKTVLGITSGTMEGRMLSLKNCEAIANGYDLDEVVEDIVKTIVPNDRGEDIWYGTSMAVGKLCFKKALEILGDKKFTKEDMGRIMVYGYDKSTENEYLSRIPFDEYIQSLQQTEWDVEIVTEPMNLDEIRDQGKGFLNSNTNKPKLDKDGCLILRRI